MNDLNNINANILLGAAISAGATERQTQEMSKKLREATEASNVASQELAAAIREQNYLLSLNEEERKEYFRIKQELEEKRRQEAEAEERKKQIEMAILEAKKKEEEEEKEERKNVIMSLAFIGAIVLFVLFVILYCVNIK